MVVATVTLNNESAAQTSRQNGRFQGCLFGQTLFVIRTAKTAVSACLPTLPTLFQPDWTQNAFELGELNGRQRRFGHEKHFPLGGEEMAERAVVAGGVGHQPHPAGFDDQQAETVGEGGLGDGWFQAEPVGDGQEGGRFVVVGCGHGSLN
jgi:hypothetical protein